MQEYIQEFSLTALCQILEVSKSGYCEWLKRKPSQRILQHRKLLEEIKSIHLQSRGTYGYRRIHQSLVARGLSCGRHCVARLMQTHNIQPKTVKKFKVTTNSKHGLAVQENILNRAFKAERLRQRLCGDITYIPTNEGWLYLATVIDLYSRRVIGWAMSYRMTAALVCNALTMALKHRNTGSSNDLLWHSDRGSQYASTEYQGLLALYGIQGSMSRRGNCWDNAVAESFFGTLKKELIYHRKYVTRLEAEKEVFEYIEVFYNRQRLHSTLGYLSPVDYENMAAAA